MANTSTLQDDELKFEIYRLSRIEGLTPTEVATITGVPRSTIRDFLSEKSHKGFWDALRSKPIAAGTLVKPEDRRERFEGKRYVFTAAQNNSYVFQDFLDSLHSYCDYNNAELVVGTFSYNKTGFQNLPKYDGENPDNQWFDPKIKPCIRDVSANLHDRVVWCGELNILPTAVNPLSGFDTYTKHMSGIIPHAKVQLMSCPVAKGTDPKFLYTTGCVTQANYIQKKAGQKAEFHHIYGAIVVEFDEEGDWFARQLIAAEDGSFYDLDKKYTPEGVEPNQRAEAINWGDLHSEKPDEDVYAGSFVEEDSLLDMLKPRYQFCHDILDFRVRNHHNIKNGFFRLKTQVYTTDRVLDDVTTAARTFMKMKRSFCDTVCVESNHDLALEKWLNTADIKFDNIYNAHFYHKCNLKIIEAIIRKEDGDFSIFADCVKEICPDANVKFLKEDESFIICPEEGGIECGSHGHLGINGMRASPATYRRLNMRYNVGHTHSAFIADGAYGAGIAGSRDQEYNKGPSTWSNSHIITYKNGKRTIITMRGRKHHARCNNR